MSAEDGGGGDTKSKGVKVTVEVIEKDLNDEIEEDDRKNELLKVQESNEIKEGLFPRVETNVEVKEEEKKKPGPRAILNLFSYATLLDWLLMLFGAIAGILHGAVLPLFVVIFGDFVNIFINQEITEGLSFLVQNSSSLQCNAAVDSSFVGLTVNDFTNGGVNCSFLVNKTSSINNVITNCFSGQAECINNDDFIDEVNVLIFIFLAMAIAVFILGTIQVALFQAACERQVKKIRLAFYRAIMRQEIGWFDANSSGELSSRISDDVDKIHDGIGDKVALLIQWLATFFGGFVVAFVREWRLTLLLLSVTPFLVIGGFFMSKLTSTFSNREQKEYASAGSVAEEVLSSIRTVYAFGGEMKECERYDSKLKEARLVGAKKGATVGFNLGFVYFLFFGIDSVAFWQVQNL